MPLYAAPRGKVNSAVTSLAGDQETNAGALVGALSQASTVTLTWKHEVA